MRSEMEQDILKVLVTEEELKARIAEMGEELYDRFQGKKPLFLSVLKGSFVFMADLVRACQLKSDVEFIAVSSYENATTSSGRVQITHDLQQDITGRHLIIVEDILDSGNTLAFLKEYFMTKGAASITIVTLLDKPSRRAKAITADRRPSVLPEAKPRSGPDSLRAACVQKKWAPAGRGRRERATAWTTPSSTGTCRISAC